MKNSIHFLSLFLWAVPGDRGLVVQSHAFRAPWQMEGNFEMGKVHLRSSNASANGEGREEADIVARLPA